MNNLNLCQIEAENHSTEPSLKSVNKIVCGPDGSMHEIKTDSTGNEWIDIGRVKRWILRCPECNKTKLCYKSVYLQGNGKMCRSCTLSIRNKSAKMRLASSTAKRGTKNHFYGLTGDLNPACRPDVRKKLKEYQQRPEVKEKRRRVYVAMMNKKRYPGGQFYSKKACDFIDAYGRENGYNFEHALNGHELQVAAYWVDGYDREKNVVFEYDEPYHYNLKGLGTLRRRDVTRMQRIQDELKCTFIRYNERSNQITHHTYDNYSR